MEQNLYNPPVGNLRRGASGRGRGVQLDRQQQPNRPNNQVFQCLVCTQLVQHAINVTFHFDLDIEGFRDLSRPRRQVYVIQFLTMINVLMNGGGGCVLMHANPCNMQFFYEQVNGRLMELIPDGTLLDERLETTVTDDQHQTVRVLPLAHRRGLPPYLSVMDFHTTLSLNKGRAKPSYAILKHLLTRVHPPRPPVPVPSPFQEGARLVKDDVVQFAEDLHHQAKVILDNPLLGAKGQTPGEKLLNLCWCDLLLPDFISAFSKQQRGGLYCIGLEEEKAAREGDEDKNVLLWQPVEGTEGLCGMFNTSMKFWKDPKNAGLYHVAEEKDVPVWEYPRTGRYLLRGVRLSEQDKTQFTALLNTRVTSQLLWWSTLQPPLRHVPCVQPSFYPVLEPAVDAMETPEGIRQGEENLVHTNLYVVEVRVFYYPGLCFHDRQGPEAYQYCHRLVPGVRLPFPRVPPKQCMDRLCV